MGKIGNEKIKNTGTFFTLPNNVWVDSKLTCADNYILTKLWLTALNKLKREVNADGTFPPMIFDNPTDRDLDNTNSLTVLKMIPLKMVCIPIDDLQEE